jgi:hypothetical protein
MEILIVNLNTDQEMTETNRKSVLIFVNFEYTVDCQSAPGGPLFIATYEYQGRMKKNMTHL